MATNSEAKLYSGKNLADVIQNTIRLINNVTIPQKPTMNMDLMNVDNRFVNLSWYQMYMMLTQNSEITAMEFEKTDRNAFTIVELSIEECEKTRVMNTRKAKTPLMAITAHFN